MANSDVSKKAVEQMFDRYLLDSMNQCISKHLQRMNNYSCAVNNYSCLQRYELAMANRTCVRLLALPGRECQLERPFDCLKKLLGATWRQGRPRTFALGLTFRGVLGGSQAIDAHTSKQPPNILLAFY